MKRIIASLLFTFLIYSVTYSQTSRYHRLRSLGTSLSMTEINSFCTESNFSHKPLAKWNIISVAPIPNNEIYEIFVDGEIKYYWVEQSFSYATDDDGETVHENNITLQSINCPSPDLSAISVSVTNSSINAGQSKSVNYTVQNIGDAHANSSSFKFYLSKNNNLTYIKTISHTSVNTGQTVSGTTTLNIPSNISSGNYYSIVMKVSTNNDSNSNNNSATSSSTFTINEIDPDNDGVLGNDDDCPNEAGPSSSNGCPGFADLKLNTNLSNAKANGASGSTVNLSNNYAHSVYMSEQLQLNLTVENIGEVSSNYMKVGIYITPSSTFDDDYYSQEVIFNGNINPTSNSSKTINISFSNLNAEANSSGWSYVHIVVDYKNDIDEGLSGGEDNNIHSYIPVQTHNKCRGCKSSSKKKTKISLENNQTFYNLDIYDLSGRLIKSTEANSKLQENNIVNTLSSGLYIIKTPTETRKIVK